AAPDGAFLRAFAEDVRLEAKGGAEHRERGERDRELLVRGGRERDRGVLRVQRLPGREVDGERSRLARPDVWNHERAGEALLEDGVRSGLRGRSAREGERGDERGEETHRDSVEGPPRNVKEDGPRRRGR